MDIEEVDDVWKQIHKKKGVGGFSGSLKRRRIGDKTSHEKVRRVYVDEKKSESELRNKDLVPLDLNERKTDVVAIGEMKALSLRNKVRPPIGGISGIAKGLSACTLNWFAIDNTDGELVIIPNNHCCANENKLKPGHEYWQPSPYDGGVEGDSIAVLKRFVELKFETYNCTFRSAFGLRNRYRVWMRDKGYIKRVWNRVDLGILSPTIPVKCEIHQLGGIHGKRRGTLGELAEKMGRTTGHTVGAKLIDNDWYGEIGYSRGNVPFGPCWLLEGDRFSQGGDSSSLVRWMKDKFTPGILHAGSDTHTIGAHWDFMEEEGDIVIAIT